MVAMFLGISKDPLYVFSRCVALSKPMHVPQTTDHSTSVHSVISHAHVYFYILTIKSFVFSIGIPLPVVVHDDGSLTAEDVKTLKHHIPGIQVIPHKESTTVMERLLKKHPTARSYRLSMTAPNRISLFTTVDIPYFAKTNKVLNLDSDILFFKRSEQITLWIQNKNNSFMYMNDYQNAYCISEKEMRKNFGSPYLPRMNMGIMGYHRKTFTLNHVNKFFTYLKKSGLGESIWHDQTYWMVHAQKYYREKIRLDKKHIVVQEQSVLEDDTKCMHYVYPVRARMFTDGIYLLLEHNFYAQR